MGWGEKAIEIRSVSQGLLDGVFMHKRANKLKFLCERNDKVFFASVQSANNSQGTCLKYRYLLIEASIMLSILYKSTFQTRKSLLYVTSFTRAFIPDIKSEKIQYHQNAAEILTRLKTQQLPKWLKLLQQTKNIVNSLK